MTADPAARAEQIRRRAVALGFSHVGIADVAPSGHSTAFRRWVERGLHGSMSWLARGESMVRRADLALTLEGVRSVVVVAHPYDQPDPEGVPDDPSIGVIARYARGRDYHKVVKKKLLELLRWIEVEGGSGDRVTGRAYVDTGPILERELAERAGLGWFGKNTMLIHPKAGSYFFIGVLLLDLELPATQEAVGDHCGSCSACLEACPTSALLGRDESGAPIMDATRCISYLTIEHRGPIPEELRPAIGNRIYGCDICQEVCPWNRKFSEPSAEPGYAARGPGEQPVGVEGLGPSGATPWHPGTGAPPLTELLETALDPARWDAFSRGSAIRRAGRAGFARNVCVALGNWLAAVDEPLEEAVAVLRRALQDESELVREHAAWALEVGGPA